jgi:hypothetical protein
MRSRTLGDSKVRELAPKIGVDFDLLKIRNCLAQEGCRIFQRVFRQFFEFLENIDLVFTARRNKPLNTGVTPCAVGR